MEAETVRKSESAKGHFKTADLLKWQGWVGVSAAAFIITMPDKALEMYGWSSNPSFEFQMRYIGAALMELSLLNIGFSKSGTRAHKLWGFWINLFFTVNAAAQLFLPQSVDMDTIGAKAWLAYSLFFAWAYWTSTPGSAPKPDWQGGKWSMSWLLAIVSATFAGHLMVWGRESTNFWLGGADLSGANLTMASKMGASIGYLCLGIATGYMLVAESGTNRQRQLACLAQIVWSTVGLYYLVDHAALKAAGGIFALTGGWVAFQGFLAYMFFKDSSWSKVKSS